MKSRLVVLAMATLLAACSAATEEYEGAIRFTAGPETPAGTPRTFRVHSSTDAFGSDDPSEQIEQSLLESGELIARHQGVCTGAIEAVAYGHDADGVHWMEGRCATP